MSHEHDEPTAPTQHLHQCGGLFGCGDEKGTGVLREDIKDAAFDKRVADRLLHMDEIDQEKFDAYLSVRGRARRKLMAASIRRSAPASPARFRPAPTPETSISTS